MDHSDYFAAVAPEELPSRIREKANDFYQTIRADGRLELWKSAYQHYYGLDRNNRHIAARPAQDGGQGELVKVKASHFRNLVQHLVNLTAQSRVSWEARSLNTDYASQTACILGGQVLDWYMRERQLERLFRQAAEYAVAFSEAYMAVDWDFEKGEKYDTHPVTGQDVKAGDLDIRTFLPIDVIREYYQDEDGRADWYIIRRYVSKFRLAAQYPEHAEELLNMAPERPGSVDIDDLAINQPIGETDRVTCFYLYHDKTPHMPQGLRAVTCGDLVLANQPFPFKKFNVHKISPADQAKTPYGYTGAFDLMGLNDVIDMLYSAVVSNNRTFAIQNIWAKPGSGFKVTQLSGGLQLLESMEKPEGIQLTASSPESYNLIKMLETLCETLSGVNSVARGNPDGALKGSSGSAMALLQSMTIQFASGLQQSYAQLVEQIGDTAIAILQTHAQAPRIAAVVGKQNRSYAKEFCGQDLDPINRVVVDMGNPAARTTAGRIQIADNLLAQQLIKTADEYLNVLSTGKLEPMTEGKQAQLLLVKAENEDLKEGRPVMVVMFDKHALHIEEHAAILADPETRRQPEIVQRVLDHIQEHINEARGLPPDLAMLTDQVPLPMPPQMGPGGPPPPGGPEGPGGPPPGPPPGPSPMDQAPGPIPEGAPGPMPGLPTNPLTGEQVGGAA